MRIVKEAEKRKHEILDAAEKLFASKSYEGTTINDILGATRIAKGTFYYHYKSKEEVMDGIIGRRIDKGLERAKVIASDGTLPAPAKLLAVIMAQKPSGPVDEGINGELNKQGNALMHQKTLSRLVLALAPVLASVVEEGIAQGFFSAPYPRESVEFLLAAALTLFDDAFFEQTPQFLASRVPAFIAAMERILGAEPGSLAGFTEVF
jgi:AcrR family transcriptional regulator